MRIVIAKRKDKCFEDCVVTAEGSSSSSELSRFRTPQSTRAAAAALCVANDYRCPIVDTTSDTVQRVRKRFPALESIRIMEDESPVLWAHRCAGTYHQRVEFGEAYCRTPGGDCSLGRRPLRLDESQTW